MNIQISLNTILIIVSICLLLYSIFQHFKISGLTKGIKLIDNKLNEFLAAYNDTIKTTSEKFKEMTKYVDDKNSNIEKELNTEISLKQSSTEKKLKQLADSMPKMNKAPQVNISETIKKPNSDAEISGLKKRISLTEDSIKTLNQKIRKS